LEAGQFHAGWTPRGWSDAKSKLVGFEQLLYLRQPGYVVGEAQFDKLRQEGSIEGGSGWRQAKTTAPGELLLEFDIGGAAVGFERGPTKRHERKRRAKMLKTEQLKMESV